MDRRNCVGVLASYVRREGGSRGNGWPKKGEETVSGVQHAPEQVIREEVRDGTKHHIIQSEHGESV